MGIQNSINSLLGTAATIAEVANISKGIKAGNAFKAEEAKSNLQGKEVDLYGAIAQNEEGVNHSKKEIAKAEKMTPKKREAMGFDLDFRKKSLEALQGQLEGRKTQLDYIRARMEQLGIPSLLPEMESKPKKVPVRKQEPVARRR